uniref:DMT(Drug/metabolite transporter) superfamily permease n=1 Tax=Desulfovibrio sp. U5L TaxID=596152 RepID=I2PXB8_9BACT
MPLSSRTAGILAALAATILWSGNFVAARGIAQAIPPFQLNFWRWLLALACVLPLALPRLRADWPGMRRHWRYLAAIGLVGVTGLNTLVYKAAQTTTSLNMALLVPTAPIMILILSRVFHEEPLTYRRVAGVGVVLLGVLTLFSHGDWQTLVRVRFASGDLIALAGVACFAAYSFFSRYRPKDVSIQGFNAAAFAWGLLFCLPGVLWEAVCLPPPEGSPAVFGSILYVGIGCSFAAYLLWTKAITAIGPVQAGMVYYSLPLFTAVEATLLLGEPIALFHVAGGAFIACGIVIATTRRK